MASLFRLVTVPDAENPNIGDIQMANGQFVPLPEGPDMLAQRIRCRLLWHRGEWYLDQRQGTPWLQELTTKGATDARIRQIFRRLVERTPGVGSVSSVEIVRGADRSASISIEAVAEEGYTVRVADLDLPYGVGV